MKAFKLIIILAVVIGGLSSAKAQSIKIKADGGKSLTFSVADLAKFNRREITATAHDGKSATYSGFDIKELLLAAGAGIGKDQLRGKGIAAYVVVEAADGYRAVFSITEFSDEFTDRTILLADRRDGAALDSNDGPFQVIVPDDKKHGRWVRQVMAIKLRKL